MKKTLLIAIIIGVASNLIAYWIAKKCEDNCACGGEK
jgi:hypothetical protein